jgi:type I restriction enzyme S subunit
VSWSVDKLIPWYSEAADGWKVQRAKTLLRKEKVLNKDRLEAQILSLTLRGVVENDPENPEGLVPADYATYQIFEKDDLVFKLIDLDNVRTSRVGHVHRRGIMSSAYTRLRPSASVDTRFMYWQFFDLYNRQIFNQLGSGVRSTLNADDVLNLPMLVPPFMRQKAIANFLDRETARIDEAIEKKRRLLHLVDLWHQEFERQTIFQSGQPLIPLRWFMSIGSGMNLNNEDLIEDGCTLVVGGNGKIGLTNQKSMIEEKSVVVGRVGALCGNVHLVEPPTWITDNALLMTNLISLTPDYLAVVLRAMDINSLANKTAQPLITGETIKSLAVPMPSKQEQMDLVRELDLTRNRNQEKKRIIEAQIELFVERRAALITAAVTGEITIPEVAA